MAKNFIAEGHRVTLESPGSAVVSGQVVVLGSESIGVALVDIAATGSGEVAVQGVWELPKATGAISLGQRLYWDADGNPIGGTAGTGAITTTASGNVPAGRAYKAAISGAATVQVILGLAWPTVETSAAEVSAADAGSHFTGTTVEEQLQEIGAHIHSTSKTVLIPLGAFTLEDGTAITKFADGASATPGFSQLSNKELALRWNNHATPAPVAFSVPMPLDLDRTANVAVRFMASLTGSTDTPVMEMEAYFDAGDTDCAGVSDPEITGTSQAAYANTILAADVPAPPAVLTVIFTPKAGELGTDDLLLRGGAWLTYKGKTTS